ncbi:MAG: peptide deformylase [Mariprofundaceae bacterium]
MNKSGRDILCLPDERLRQQALPVHDFDAGLQALLSELETVMRYQSGSVGIAAPQIGENSCVVLVDCSASRRPCRNHGLLELINPEINSLEGEVVMGREGCLSVPDWVGMVPRSRQADITYQDRNGDKHQLQASGFEARVIQHEIDHLHGLLFIDRMVSTSDLVRRMG